MREVLFILFVVFVLLGLTALRYRKQVATVIRFSQMLREGRVGQNLSTARRNDQMAAEPLVKCSSCGTWVPENRARRLRSGDFYCSNECLEAGAKVS